MLRLKCASVPDMKKMKKADESTGKKSDVQKTRDLYAKFTDLQKGKIGALNLLVVCHGNDALKASPMVLIVTRV